MTIAEIKKMSIVERLQTMEDLWNVLCHEEKGVDSPEWHREILEKRNEMMKSGKAEFITLEQLKARAR
ncbi:hypothetical protein MNBD_UNCLBAC01-1115 [hydrothermal vent metagenome]|uniref:Addiction module component CHP02574 family protein n=1 Tax=hydrothermal vent metagenome TaxID=652676 RepID=A0A3B1D5F7_9ZZZZ